MWINLDRFLFHEIALYRREHRPCLVLILFQVLCARVLALGGVPARNQVVPEPWVVVHRSVAGVCELLTRVGLAHVLLEVDARSPVLLVAQHRAALPVQADVAKLPGVLGP